MPSLVSSSDEDSDFYLRIEEDAEDDATVAIGYKDKIVEEFTFILLPELTQIVLTYLVVNRFDNQEMRVQVRRPDIIYVFTYPSLTAITAWETRVFSSMPPPPLS
jgi:hypothetical protein